MFPYFNHPLLQAIGIGDATTKLNPPNKIVLNMPSVTKPASRMAGSPIKFRIYAYQIQGMDCQECADGLQAVIAGMPGVKKAAVSYQHGTAEVQTAAGFNPHRISARISRLGDKTTLVKTAIP